MNNAATLVALLESDYSEEKLNKSQNLRETLEAGLNWDTNYWVDCALNWIEQGFELDMQLVEKLEVIASNKILPQKTRHRSYSYAKRWRKINGI